MQLRLSLILVAGMLTACGGGSSDGDSNSGTTAGTTAGGTTAGGVTAGDTTAGGTDAGNAGGGSVSQLGFVDVDQFDFGGATPDIELSAGFISSSSAISFDAITNEINPSSDICEVRENVSFLDDEEDIDFTNINPGNIISISAGETVTFTSPAGTFATLNRESGFGFIGYNLELDSGTTLPADLTVDIPGDQFPAFANVAVPPVQLLTGVSVSSGNVVNANSTFTWDAGTDPNSRISISANTDFDFANLLTSTRTEVDCYVLDDGAFNFPASIQAQLGSFSATEVYVSRSNVTFLRNGNALLVVSSYSE